jgi:hypothetical protein
MYHGACTARAQGTTDLVQAHYLSGGGFKDNLEVHLSADSDSTCRLSGISYFSGHFCRCLPLPLSFIFCCCHLLPTSDHEENKLRVERMSNFLANECRTS